MLAIVTSHPIQYQAPVWRALAEAGLDFEVWFLTRHAVAPTLDRDFGKSFSWDVDLLSGYPHRFLEIREGATIEGFNGIELARGWEHEFRSGKVTSLWLEGWRFRTLWQAAAAAKRAGIGVLMRGESPDLIPTRLRDRLVKRPALRWLFRRVDHFLCIGSSNRRFYLGHGVPDARLHPAPYCVDNARFAAAAAARRPERAAIRERWGIDPGAWCLLQCGKLMERKRPLDLVAGGRLAARHRKIHLLFAGDGRLAGEVSNALNAPSTPAGTITGFLNQSEVVDAYVAADCLVLPSDYWETWGLVVNEALACGTPAVVSDRCGCAEDLALPQGPHAVFPCGDIPAFARSIESAAAAPPAPALLASISEAHDPARTAETVRRLLGAGLKP